MQFFLDRCRLLLDETTSSSSSSSYISLCQERLRGVSVSDLIFLFCKTFVIAVSATRKRGLISRSRIGVLGPLSQPLCASRLQSRRNECSFLNPSTILTVPEPHTRHPHSQRERHHPSFYFGKRHRQRDLSSSRWFVASVRLSLRGGGIDRAPSTQTEKTLALARVCNRFGACASAMKRWTGRVAPLGWRGFVIRRARSKGKKSPRTATKTHPNYPPHC